MISAAATTVGAAANRAAIKNRSSELTDERRLRQPNEVATQLHNPRAERFESSVIWCRASLPVTVVCFAKCRVRIDKMVAEYSAPAQPTQGECDADNLGLRANLAVSQ